MRLQGAINTVCKNVNDAIGKVDVQETTSHACMVYTWGWCSIIQALEVMLDAIAVSLLNNMAVWGAKLH